MLQLRAKERGGEEWEERAVVEVDVGGSIKTTISWLFQKCFLGTSSLPGKAEGHGGTGTHQGPGVHSLPNLSKQNSASRMTQEPERLPLIPRIPVKLVTVSSWGWWTEALKG